VSFSKRVDEARKAYKNKDKMHAALAHTSDEIAHSVHEDHGGTGSKYIGDLVYGGLDGIITTFAIVSGVAGAELGSGIILIMGVANLLADGFSMATGAYLAAKSEQEYYEKEYQREMWEVEQFPEGEKQELYEVYLHQGYNEEEATQLIKIKTRTKARWVESMMIDELGMLKDDANPLYNGLATLVAFLVAGILPLLVYLFGIWYPVSSQLSFQVSIILSALGLFGIGASKVMVTQQNPFKSGFEMLFVGGLAATVAFFVGVLLKGFGI
jgi:vacuolar iron transporter family protein